MAEIEVAPIAPEAAPLAPNEEELEKLWTEYLQKCCEVGQIQFQLEQLESQQKEIEKNLDVTQRAVRSAAQKHRELQKANMQKLAKEVVQ